MDSTGTRAYRLEDNAGVARGTVYRFLSGQRTGLQMETYIKLKQEMHKHLDNEVVWTPDTTEEEATHV